MEGIEATSKNERMTLILALNYSGKWDILQAARQVAELVRDNKINPGDISEALFQDRLATHGVPDPELLIRTSGEYRISNFLLWQLAYSELYFTPVFWPDFRKEHFYQALLDYQHRERRFGKISEQFAK